MIASLVSSVGMSTMETKNTIVGKFEKATFISPSVRESLFLLQFFLLFSLDPLTFFFRLCRKTFFSTPFVHKSMTRL